MSAMPQLNEAEHKFFESGGREMAASLSEAPPAHAEPAMETEAPAEAGGEDGREARCRAGERGAAGEAGAAAGLAAGAGGEEAATG